MKTVPLPMKLPDLERKLVAFVRNEVAAAGFHRAVVGVSGGVDSAVVLLLAVRALGAEDVLGLLMPYRTSAPESLSDARTLIALAGCRSEEIDITPMVDAFRAAAGVDDRLRLGNKMARERMSLLYDRALREQALVLGTGNKTEILLGYSTRWGDAACDLNPIGDLYKQHVVALAVHLGAPPAILDKAPSADLWPGQTDEGELGATYDVMDRVLWWLVDHGGDPDCAAAELDVAAETVRAIQRRVVRTEFKRRSPPICKVQAHAVGIDFEPPPDWSV